MIVLDTSGVIALFWTGDRYHRQALAAIKQLRGPLILPAGVLSETAYMLDRLGGTRLIDLWLAALEDGSLGYDSGTADFARIRILVDRYTSLPLGFADASVVACAERSGGIVLTFDNRHFDVVAAEGTIKVVGRDSS